MKNLYISILTLFTLLFLGFSTEVAAQGNTCASAIPITVNINSCSYTSVSNVGLTASGQLPVGASCTGYSGGDLWLSVLVPPSGELFFDSKTIQGTSNLLMDINLAVYSGACGALTNVGCNEDGGAGFYPAITITGTPGSTMFIQLWDKDNNQSSSFQVCANGTPTCTSPTATYTRQCLGNNEYQVTMNLTGLGDASAVDITNDVGASDYTGVTATGTYVVGPIALGQQIVITIEHAEDNTCNKIFTLSDLGITCENEITCGIPKNVIYCYGNQDPNRFLYSSLDNSPITITFNSGKIHYPNDIFIIRDGDNASSPILYQGGGTGPVTGSTRDLSGFTRTASSGSMYIQILSDAGGSCQDGSLGINVPWNYDITCEGNTPCENASELISQNTFAASQITGDLAGAVFSGLSQCNGPGSKPDRYFKFTAEGTVTYFRVQAGIDFDPAVEVYDGCGGTQLACVNDAPAGQTELFWVTGLTIGVEYVYRVYHAGVGTPVVTEFQTAVAHIPTIQLRAADCGATDLVSTSIIRSTVPNPNYLVDAYIWEFTELEAPFNVYEVISPNGANPQFRIYWFPNYEYGRSYSVRTKARMFQGPNVGEYGAACTIALSTPQGSALQPFYENGFFQLCDIVKAVSVSGSTNYRWTFDDGTTMLEYNSYSSSYVLSLQNVSGLQLGTSYAVNVYVTNGGTESPTSIERTINMVGSVQNTSLNPGIIACGSTVNLTQNTQAFNVCAATSYTFRFENVTQPLETVIETTRPNRVLQFGWVPGLIAGDTYNVFVKASAGGLVGDYSSACEITIAALSGKSGNATSSETFGSQQGGENASIAALSVHPNPVSTGSEITVSIVDMVDAQQNVRVDIYDLTGKLLLSEQFGNTGSTLNATIKLGQKVTTGIYILKTSVNGVPLSSKKLIIE